MRSLLALLLLTAASPLDAADPGSAIAIGDRRELLVDHFLVDKLSGGARLQLHPPVPREIVLRSDAPWEGNACGYHSVFQDGEIYRMYYHGGHYRHGGKPAETRPVHPWFLCYAESNDGIHWRRPELGLFEFEGSKKNNIILTPESVAAIGGDPAHTAVFKDANPDCPADARYKCVIVGKPHGLYLLKSADGIRFSVGGEKPVITRGAFDSENLAFWDPVRKEYRAYWRIFTAGVADGTTWKPEGIRAIRTATSKDSLTWSGEADLQYVDSPPQQLYTNQIQPYYRAPHIFMGFPMRYTDRGWSESMMALPGLEERLARSKASPRYGTAITDGLFMTSRDGVLFHRWNEAFLRPGPRRQGSWVYGDNMIFWGMVETASALGDAPNELSLYASEDYWQGGAVSFRRLTLRIDGFVSLCAPARGGELVTKPLVFDGGNLTLNAATSGAGSIQVEIQDGEGKPVPGYALADCPELFGDDLALVVRWRKGGDVRPLCGKTVRLRFVLNDADLYAFQFVPYQPDPARPDPSAKP
ncbi:MAG: hypothetical protein HUU20_14625 [Pirellulales bacterium]|nr:hypothetical protein [Pirellulales bacterium]